MHKQANAVLYQVAAETLEQLAYFFVEKPEDDDIFEPTDEMVTAVASFNGPFSGCVGISLALNLLPEVASNMLGIEDGEISEQEQVDAFKEVANILCGNLLPKIAGPEKVFDIDSPVILEKANAFVPEKMELIGEVILTIDETDCKLQLFVEEPVPKELLKI